MQGSRLSKSYISSPIKSEVYNTLQDDKKLILRKLNYLFIYYAAKTSRYAYREMSEKSFMELIEDIYVSAGKQLFKNSDAWKKLVTLYYGRGKKTTGMVFQEFLKMLPAISSHFSRSTDCEDDLKYLMKHLIEVYKKKVCPQIEERYVQFKKNIQQNTLNYISKLAEQLFIVYKLYFPQEMTTQTMLQSFENVVLFFKQFEIYPKIISASQLYMIFLEIIMSDSTNAFTWADEQRKKIGERGSIFTFPKFIDVLVRVASVGVSKLRQIQNPQWWIQHQKQSVKALLQYMQNVKLKNKNSKFKQIRFSFILIQEYTTEGEKWISQNDKNQQGKQLDFFQLFEKMKI